MNTLELDKKISASGFLGAFPYDEIPPKPDSKLFSLIINIDPSTAPGEHWTALFYKEPSLYFFDSYGRDFKDATLPKSFSDKIKDYIGDTKYKYNTMWLQPLTTNTCGNFCVYFIEEMTKNRFSKVFEIFTKDLRKNDLYVRKYVKNL